MKVTGTHSALTNSALHRESWFLGAVRYWAARPAGHHEPRKNKHPKYMLLQLALHRHRRR